MLHPVTTLGSRTPRGLDWRRRLVAPVFDIFITCSQPSQRALVSGRLLALLHTYLPPIIDRFYGGDLPLPALSLDYARPGNLGWYCDEDGLALCHRININRLYADRPFAEVLRTLTHEVGHCWQHLSGKPS